MSQENRIRVVFFHRRPEEGHYSVEGYFDNVRRNLPYSFKPEVVVSRFRSKGVLRRLYNVFEASMKQGDVNHITGDVHFLNYFMAGRRTVLTILDCSSLERTMGIRKKLLLLMWYLLPVWRSVIITVISEATKREVLRYVDCDPAKIHVVPVSISPAFSPHHKPFNVRKPRILQIGTKPNKNLPRLFAALEGISCHLDIVGKITGEHRLMLERYTIDYSNYWSLTEAEIVERYKASDIVSLVSTYEGFGMPIIEANAVGRPVITGDILSMPEVAGDAACVVDPYDVNAIRDGITRIIRDEAYRNQLVARGFRNARRYDPEHIAHTYATIYSSIAIETSSAELRSDFSPQTYEKC